MNRRSRFRGVREQGPSGARLPGSGRPAAFSFFSIFQHSRSERNNILSEKKVFVLLRAPRAGDDVNLHKAESFLMRSLNRD